MSSFVKLTFNAVDSTTVEVVKDLGAPLGIKVVDHSMEKYLHDIIIESGLDSASMLEKLCSFERALIGEMELIYQDIRELQSGRVRLNQDDFCDTLYTLSDILTQVKAVRQSFNLTRSGSSGNAKRAKIRVVESIF